ncbi:hypothetical protein J7412_21810, partial [Shimia sp. R9_3]|nr:hypothetical protein [Shimia sp. R9_3]
GDDLLTGSATGARILFGGEGDDVLTATYRGGTSDLFGQGGNDTYRLTSDGGSVYIHDGEGANRLELVDVALAEVSFSQDDTFTRLTWEDATHGTTQAKIHRSTNFEEFAFADGATVGQISFGDGGVRLSGTSGDDILTGSATGARILFGGEGDDVLTATYRGGTSDLFGQGGNDAYRLISAGGSVYIH